MVTGGPEGFYLLLNLLNIWLLWTVFIFSYLSAPLYSVVQLIAGALSCSLFLLWLEEGRWPFLAGFFFMSSFGGDVCKDVLLTFPWAACFPSFYLFLGILVTLLRTWPNHLLSLPSLLRDADKMKGLPEPNKHLLFICLAMSFQNLCHVYLFRSLNVEAGRFPHCLF